MVIYVVFLTLLFFRPTLIDYFGATEAATNLKITQRNGYEMAASVWPRSIMINALALGH